MSKSGGPSLSNWKICTQTELGLRHNQRLNNRQRFVSFWFFLINPWCKSMEFIFDPRELLRNRKLRLLSIKHKCKASKSCSRCNFSGENLRNQSILVEICPHIHVIFSTSECKVSGYATKNPRTSTQPYHMAHLHKHKHFHSIERAISQQDIEPS